MRSKKIKELNELTSADTGDLFVVYDVSASETKKIKKENMPGGGGGYTKLVATGVIDDLNTEFTFTQKPSAININGGIFGEGEGQYAWTWDEPTLTATLAFPLGTGSFIHGVV